MCLNLTAAAALVLTAMMVWANGQGKEQEKKAKVELPPAVAKAIRDNIPNAEIDIVEVEEDAGIRLYDIEFKADKGEIEVAEDGTVIDVTTVIQMKEIPKAAAHVIQKAVGDAKAKISRLEKSEVRAEVQKEGEKGKVVKLASARYVYEAEVVRGKQRGEIQVAPDGKIVEALKWEAAGEKK
jgi:uncharacterized membrane protein YkoI